jgi:alkanesulfonate monooxygenase SsuD/methylene tetrahydromethanopterin reductase-like flavin-dependent oxidoreductase (luciferase family)
MSQYRMPVADFVSRAQTAEAGGFDGVAFFDHLETPGMPSAPVWEAMGIATWIAAKTDRIKVGHLVRGDADELVRHFTRLSDQGAQRFYVWFADSAQPEAIEEFGDSVIGAFRATGSDAPAARA